MRVLEKRTSESRLYDFDCTDDLPSGVTISSVGTITSDQGGLTFGAGVVNAALVTYPDGRTAAIGKAIQVLIGGGELPPDIDALDCTVRAPYTASNGETLEATGVLRLTNKATT